MSIRRRLREQPDDEGLSLIELIVVVVIVGVLSGVIVMILVNSWNAQQSVNSTTVATNEGQVYASSIERAVRNAEAIDVTGGTLLRVRTTLAGERECQSFQITPSATDADAAYMASASGATTWSGAWIDAHVAPLGGGPYFSLTADGALAYGFQIGTEAAPVIFDGTVALRNELKSGAPCW